MAKRRAPKGGYKFDEKVRYREALWRTVKAHIQRGRFVRHALLMPSLEGAEIDVALSMGFSEANLHICDMNPAIVATLKRRYPRINTYGVTIERACERIAASGVRLDFANLDLTANFSGSSMGWLRSCRRSGAFKADALIAVSLLRGRETMGANAVLKHVSAADVRTLSAHISAKNVGPIHELKTTDCVRVAAAMSSSFYATRVRPRIVTLGCYPSGRQTMLWALFGPTSKGSHARVASVANMVALAHMLEESCQAEAGLATMDVLSMLSGKNLGRTDEQRRVIDDMRSNTPSAYRGFWGSA